VCNVYTGHHRWSVASSDAEAGSREMVCPICRELLRPSDAQTHLILEFSQLKQLVNTYVQQLRTACMHASYSQHMSSELNSSSDLITCLPMELFYFTAHEFHFANSSLCATWKHVFRIPVQLMCREHGFIVTRLPAAMYLCATLSSCFYWRRLVDAQKYRISRAMSCR